MSTTSDKIAITAVTTAVAAVVALVTVSVKAKRHAASESHIKKLPKTLKRWRFPLNDLPKNGRALWEFVRPDFKKAGIDLWRYDRDEDVLHPDPESPFINSGFAFISPSRGEAQAEDFRIFYCHNHLLWAGTNSEGHTVVVRVIKVADDGKEHLRILRKLACGATSLRTDNHVVPLWGEVSIDHVTFAVFPFVGYGLGWAYGRGAQNSVGDIVNMILQALEGLAYVHSLGIAHGDSSKLNYHVQWFPESLTTMRVPTCHPRVYMIDFGHAYEFAQEVPESERLLVGLPEGMSGRSVAPEIASGKPYNPFKADVWRLGNSFSDFKSTIEEIDSIMEELTVLDPSSRLSAAEACVKLADIVHALPATAFLIPPKLSDTPWGGLRW